MCISFKIYDCIFDWRWFNSIFYSSTAWIQMWSENLLDYIEKKNERKNKNKIVIYVTISNAIICQYFFLSFSLSLYLPNEYLDTFQMTQSAWLETMLVYSAGRSCKPHIYAFLHGNIPLFSIITILYSLFSLHHHHHHHHYH